MAIRRLTKNKFLICWHLIYTSRLTLLESVFIFIFLFCCTFCFVFLLMFRLIGAVSLYMLSMARLVKLKNKKLHYSN